MHPGLLLLRRTGAVVACMVLVAVGLSATAPGRPAPSSRPHTVLLPRAQTVSAAPVQGGISLGAFYENRLEADSPTARDAVMAAMHTAGVRWIRIDVPDVTRYDDVVRSALAAGMQVDILVEDWVTADTPAAMGVLSTTLAQHYSALGVHTYEILNEPNVTPQTTGKTPALYTSLLQASYTHIHAVDPNATVISAGLAPAADSVADSTYEPYTYLSDMYAAGAQGYMDAIGEHPYSFPDYPTTSNDPKYNPWQYMSMGWNNQSCGFTNPNPATCMYAIMNAHGDGAKKIWTTEFGVPTGTAGGQPTAFSQSFQATSIVQAFNAASSVSYAGPIFNFQWQDDSEGDFGLLDQNGNPKEALSAFTKMVTPASPHGGAYTPVTPTRIADTRAGSGQPSAAQTLPPGGNLPVDVGIQVPSTATAVALSVTAVDGSQSGFLDVYPDDTSGGAVNSVVNFVAGNQTCTTADCVATNLVLTALTARQVTIRNGSGGTVNVVVDLEGYFDPTNATTSGTGHYVAATAPSRQVDTRCAATTPSVPIPDAVCSSEDLPPANAGKTTLRPGGTLNVATGLTHASAAVVNLTVTNASATSYLTAYSGTGARPPTANLNFVRGQTVTTRAIVPVGADGSINIYDYAGTADVIVDLAGSFGDSTTSSTTGTLFTPVAPHRITDTRTSTAIGPNSSISVPVADRAGMPAAVNGQPTTAALNITEADSTQGGYLTVTTNAITPPAVISDSNFSAGNVGSNADMPTLDASGNIGIYNLAGRTNVLVDAFGYFSAGSG